MRITVRVIVAALLVGLVVLVFWGSRTTKPGFFPASAYSAASSSPVPAEDAAADIVLPAATSAPVMPNAKAASSFKSAVTTGFFAGEAANGSNADISKDRSYWDNNWAEHAAAENPFYFALPYGEFDSKDALKRSAKLVPWYKSGLSPLLKNHWIEVVHDGHICFGQWEDVGPNGDDDFAYVFGSSTTPSNTLGEKAALTVSPALWKCLGMTDKDITSWKFVGASEVPSGLWKDMVTSSPASWGN